MRFIALAGILLAGGIAALPPHDVVTTSITWNREISRIVFDRCVSCHNNEKRSPAFSLLTYGEARPWAVAIKEEVLNRRMPPWGAVKGFGEFRNDQSLTQEQISLITAWVEGGVPEGNPKDLPARPKINKPATVTMRRNQIVVSGEYRLRSAMKVSGILPDKIPAGLTMKVQAQLPDGSILPLVWLYEYRNEFKHPFLFKTPLNLPAGTIIRGVPEGVSILLLPA